VLTTRQLVGGQPVWAKLFYLVRTGHGAEALDEAVRVQRALEGRDPGFVALFKAWLESGDRRLPRAARETLRAGYNAHQLRAGGADPFKLALYKLMGRVEPSRRSVPLATATTEDWLWFQLAMVDEEEQGLAALADVLLGYGEAHFDAQGKRRGVWAGVLVMCGQFERVGALSSWRKDISHREGLGGRSTLGASRDRGRGGSPRHRTRISRPAPCADEG
jgi:nuclear pore complex protein Nup93